MDKRGIILVILLLCLSTVIAISAPSLKLDKTSYGPNSDLAGSFDVTFSDLPGESKLILKIGGQSAGQKTLKEFKDAYSSSYSFSETGGNYNILSNVPSHTVYLDSAKSEIEAGIPQDSYSSINLIVSGSILSPVVEIGGLRKSYKNYNSPTGYSNLVNELGTRTKSYIIHGNKNEAYCNYLPLEPAKKYKIKALLKKHQDYKTAKLIASISSGTPTKACDVSADNKNGAEQCCELNVLALGTEAYREIECEVQKENAISGSFYSLCIYTTGDESATNEFIVGADDTNNYFITGSYETYNEQLSGDWAISLTQDEILNIYSGISSIPINVSAAEGGSVTLKNLAATSEGGEFVDKFQVLAYIPSKIKLGTIGGTITIPLSFIGAKTPQSDGEHTLVACVDSTCSESKKFDVKPLPTISLNASKTMATISDLITFDASSSKSQAGNISNFTWDFNDGTKGTGSIVNHTFGKLGTFNVTVIITDSSGLQNNKTIKIQIISAIKNLGSELNSTKELVKLTKAEIESDETVKSTMDMLGINLDGVLTNLSLLETEYRGAVNMSNGSTRENKLALIQKQLLSLVDSVPLNLKVEVMKFPAKIVSLGQIPEPTTLGIEATDVNLFKENLFTQQKDVNIDGEARLVDITYLSNKKEKYTLIKKLVSGSGEVYEVLPARITVIEMLTPQYQAVLPNSIYKWTTTSEIKYKINEDDLTLASKARTFVIKDLQALNVASSGGLTEGFNCGNQICDWGEDDVSCPEDCGSKKPVWLYATLAIVVVFGIFYLNFYKGKYNFEELQELISKKLKKEKLFNSNDDFKSLKSFVENSLAKGMDKEQTRIILKKRGWTDSQINYVLKKLKKY